MTEFFIKLLYFCDLINKTENFFNIMQTLCVYGGDREREGEKTYNKAPLSQILWKDSLLQIDIIE